MTDRFSICLERQARTDLQTACRSVANQRIRCAAEAGGIQIPHDAVKVRVIDGIQRLEPKLKLHAFGNPEVLEERSVQAVEPRPSELVPVQRAELDAVSGRVDEQRVRRTDGVRGPTGSD